MEQTFSSVTISFPMLGLDRNSRDQIFLGFSFMVMGFGFSDIASLQNNFNQAFI
jgi:hypothetical protein